MVAHGHGNDSCVRFGAREAQDDMRRSAPAVARCALLGATLLASVLSAPPALALEEQKSETQALDACDERLCRMLQQKTPAG